MHRYYYYRHGPGCGDAHFETGWRENRAGRMATMPVERVGDTLLVWTNSHAAVGVVTGTNLRCDWPSGWKYRNVAVRWLARAPMRDVQFDDRFDVWKRATTGGEATADLQRVARRVAEHVMSIQPSMPVAHPQPAHPQSVHPQSVHPQSAHPQSVHPQSAHPQSAHPQSVLPQSVLPQPAQAVAPTHTTLLCEPAAAMPAAKHVITISVNIGG